MATLRSLALGFDKIPGLFRAVVQKCAADKCLLRAAALAYATVLSLVPLLAVAFSISKGLGFQNSALIRTVLLQLTAGREELVQSIIGYIDNTRVSTLGVLGTALLFVTVLSLLSTIETTFNALWKTETQRTLWRKFSDYLSITLVCPLFFIMAFSMSASLESSSVSHMLESLPFFSVVLKLIPLFTACAALFFLYFFIPNTAVRTVPALTGALCAGILWHGTQILYVRYLADSMHYNAIYGSFAQVPLFLVWMFICWLIVLLGAQISCVVQKKITTASVRLPRHMSCSLKDRQKLAVMLLTLLTHKFIEKKGALSDEALAQTLTLPVALVHEIFLPLESAGLVIRMDKGSRQEYIVSRPPETITVHAIMTALSEYADQTEQRQQNRETPDSFFTALFDDLDQAQKNTKANMTLVQCTQHWPAPAQYPTITEKTEPSQQEPKKIPDDTTQP